MVMSVAEIIAQLKQLTPEELRQVKAAAPWSWRYDGPVFSFVDGTSFAIMVARGLTAALTADLRFATAGFVPLGVA